MFDCGVHALDLSIMLFGQPRRVSALGARLRTERTYDAVSALLDYDRLMVRVFSCQSAEPLGNDVEITFTRGSVRVPSMLTEGSARMVELVAGDRREMTEFEPVDLYRLEVENFCRYLEGNQPHPGTTATDALAASRLLFLIEDSIRRGEVLSMIPG